LNFDQGGCLNVHGHAVVLHAPSSDGGTRVGCGTIGQDPWLGLEAVASNGTANNVIKVPGYAFDDTGVSDFVSSSKFYNAYGRVVVLHDPDGTRIACAENIVAGTALTFNPYPGYTGDNTVTGDVTVDSTTCDSGGQCVSLTLNVDVSAYCDTGSCGGVHIHSGTSCGVADNVGGHFFKNNVAIMQPYPDYDYSGGFVADGIAMVEDVSDTTSPSIQFTTHLGNVAGFAADSTGGIHIHDGAATNAGSACTNASTIGGHMYLKEYTELDLTSADQADPWIDVKWDIDATSCFNPQINDQIVPYVTFGDEGQVDVDGHAVVVHDESGVRIGCGVINDDPWIPVKWNSDGDTHSGDLQDGSSLFGFSISDAAEYTGEYTNALGRVVVVHNAAGGRVGCGCCVADDSPITIDAYPGTNQTVTGTVTVVDNNDGTITLSAELSGLDNNATGGLHIHTGTSCAVADNVGGHLYREGGAQIGPYPEYDGDVQVRGFVDVAAYDGSQGILFSTSLVSLGLPSDSTGGVHIHEGTTCDSASEVGGHFWESLVTTSTTTATATTTTTEEYYYYISSASEILSTATAALLLAIGSLIM